MSRMSRASEEDRSKRLVVEKMRYIGNTPLSPFSMYSFRGYD
jgi:hypothetical protein